MNTPELVAAKMTALIQRDGDIVDVYGENVLAFHKLIAGQYHLAVRHRNHLGAMTQMGIISIN